MKLTTHVHQVPMLRMSGSIPQLPLYAFMTWTGETLHSRFRISEDVVGEMLKKEILTTTKQLNVVDCYAGINSVV